MAESLPRSFECLVCGEHDDFDVFIERLQFAQHVHPGHTLHQDTENRNVRRPLASELQGVLSIGCEHDIKVVFENDLERSAWPFLVVHDEKDWFRR